MVGVGQRVGNYRVLRKLGQGGMGAVYEALHEEIGRRAAIKVLLPEFAQDQQNILRFFNEARAVNIIQHPGLVGVFESGRLEDGAAYIVMEYLEGELLTTRLQKAGRLPLRSALTLVRQIASALAAAHIKRIVHRDLKPDNIMLIPDPETPEGERVKVFDFGIAKLRVDSLGPNRAQPMEFRTETGIIMGTPTHMAPEQCRGASDVTGKADVYSLGVILYQVLIGHPPFVAASAGELLSMHLRDQPTPLRKLDPGIPENLADLVHRMLEKDPGERPEMSEVVLELESLGAHRTRASQSDAHIPVKNPEKAKPRPNTLQNAAGQTFSTSTQKRFVLAIGLSGVLVVIAGVLLFTDGFGGLTGHPSGTVAGRETGFAPPRPRLSNGVRWSIESEPTGAEVVNTETGNVIGKTPYVEDRPRESGELRLRVRLAGHVEQTVIVDRSSNLTTTVHLNPAAPSVPESTSSAAQKPPEVPRPGTVHWNLQSRPSGAQIVRAETGEVLGITPWDTIQPAAQGTLKLVLRAPGYADTLVLLDRFADMENKFILKRISPRTPKKSVKDEIPLFDNEDSDSSSGSGSAK